MTPPIPVDLLSDLTKLLKKHGAEAFRSLAAALQNPSVIADVSALLEAIPALQDRIGARSSDAPSLRTPTRDRLQDLHKTEPVKAELLKTLLSQLQVPETISLAALRAYAQRSGLPDLPSGDRRRVALAFVASLVDLDIQAIQDHIQALSTARTESGRELKGWSRIILDPDLRSKQGA